MDFPVVDKVVNTDNCYYYLSLLERFVSVIESMDKEELLQYLVRAESRYFRWIFCPLFISTKREVPPLDVAFFWQTHMLSPLRYHEDMIKHFGGNNEDCPIPLKDIHESRYEPTPKALHQWIKVMGKSEPYIFEGSRTESYHTNTSISCIVCGSPAKTSWKSYTEWRTNPDVAIRCYCCDAEYTIKHCGKANLFRDVSYDFKISGLSFDKKGQFNPKKNIKIENYLLSSHNLAKLPFDSGGNQIRNFMATNQERFNPNGNNTKKNQEQNELMGAIMTTYFCTPYRGSIDMLMAVTRQLKFAIRVTSQIDWQLPNGIIYGIRGYFQFIRILKFSPGLVGVPDVGIDLAWHTHMLYPARYRDFTTSHLKTILNHDDCIPPEELPSFEEKFNMAKRYFLKEESENKDTKSKGSIFKWAFTSSSTTAKKDYLAFGYQSRDGNFIIDDDMIDPNL
ncbi:uncharacterized protein EV154DRAFT_505785 [Mucor mucedo]|uniref:uncharacterized protein n=1 Tax=Mucor mucedo TaxID=29922 RepID=UPI00221F614D|nr:uncharacterized protein EV154DRAFT_505785 [Mucor mucedo]KAI7892154.1 hypothetical protein EV154DRAFT_505785 [Mucor mucedo]